MLVSNIIAMRKSSFLYPVLYSLLIVGVPLVSPKGDSVIPYYYERGNELYKKGDYGSALEAFRKAINEKEVITQRFPWIHFKIGFCQYQIAKYQDAIRTFQENAPELQIIKDYVEFFVIRSKLASGDTLTAVREFGAFLDRYPDSPVTPIIDSLCAEIHFARGNFDLASRYYKKQLKYPYFDKGDLYSKLIEIEKIVGGKNLESLLFTLIEKYPFHPKSESSYLELLKILGSRIPETKFTKLFDYVVETRQYEKAERLLRFQIGSNGETELTRWLKIELQYKRGNYAEALQACFEQRKTFSQLKYLREIDLHIARCYLRLGQVDKSIEAYAIFQRRFPTDYLSPEVLWKIAWLYEELKDYSMARQYYEKLNTIYPRSQFLQEARFRVGLNYYRDQHYILARVAWQKALALENDRYEKPRYQYWIAKTYLREKDFVNYLKELENLTDTPFLSYYNLKAFLLTTDDDSRHHQVDSLLWEMHHDQTSHLGGFINLLQRTLVVQEILGNIFARYELDNHFDKTSSQWEYRFALAELNENLGNYGKAYRLFRNIYNKYFSNQEWQQWVFLFKRLYPLYFDTEVNQNAEKRNLTPEIIWAIIKKESAFAPRIVSYANAHGLMQIIPPTAHQIARELGMDFKDIRLLYEPEVNIDMGSYYLTELLKRYQWNLYYALAAYNAGPHRVDRWQKIIDTNDDDFFMENIEFSQTRSYVRVVLRYYWTYYLILHPQDVPDDVFSFPKKLTREDWYNELIRK